MKRTWTFALFQHEQPSNPVWDELVQFANEWNDSHEPKFTKVMETMWNVNFDASTMDAMETLKTQLEQLKQTSDIAYHEASRGHLEDDDYARADFIEIMGVNFGALSDSFVLNMEKAIAPGSSCPECGWQDIFDSTQQAAFIIDESLLDNEIDNVRPEGTGSWDMVELPSGQTLISERLAALLEHNEVESYNLIEVINSATGCASERMFQLIANRIVLTPCMEHSRIEGEPFCSTCGAARGSLEEYFWARNDWVAGDEVISRHPTGSVMIYVSRRIYQQLMAQGFNGIHRNDVIFCCYHEKKKGHR